MEQELQNIDSLYDFLYVDRERASSLITQLYAPGVVTSVKRTSSESDKSNNSGGFDLKLAKGTVSVEEAISHTQERLFDASWALPINLLDKLSENGFIQTGLNSEKLGSTVLTRGRVSFFDISFFQKGLPFFGKFLLNQIATNKQQKKIKIEDLPLDDGITFGMMSDILEMVPNTLQVDFIDENGINIWMTLNKDNLTINPDDMVLKYGGNIPGEWFVIGLIDALPDKFNTYLPTAPANPLKDGLKEMIQSIKELAGRSPEAYGMTPLIIFRKVN